MGVLLLNIVGERAGTLATVERYIKTTTEGQQKTLVAARLATSGSNKLALLG